MMKILVALVTTILLAISTNIYAASSTMDKIGQDFSDTGITASVMALYVKDADLNIFKINVSTTNGVVTLSGTVDNETEYQKAISLAQSVDGVKSVIYTGLTVKNTSTTTTSTDSSGTTTSIDSSGTTTTTTTN